MDKPETRYATTSDGLSIAYQQFGAGPDLVWVTGTASHIELFWEFPGWAHMLRSLARDFRVTWFDKRGTGLSDRTLGSESLEDRMEDIRAVMDATGIDRATVVGLSESGAMCGLFAATFPERVDRLVVVATWAHRPTRSDVTTTMLEQWGNGVLLERIWAQGSTDVELLGRIERAMGTPTSVASVLRANSSIDVRSVLPLVKAPTLVVHCTDDPVIPVAHGREFASLVPGAVMTEVAGSFHGSARVEDADRYVQAITPFLGGSGPTADPAPDRFLTTVLFTDIVESTRTAEELGDRRWTGLLDQHDDVCTRAVERAGGRVVKSTGDGLLATFDGPTKALAAAHRMSADLGLMGVRLRAGVHTGEVERRNDDIGGLGVHVAARVMAAAAPGEVWASSTVPGLAVGGGIGFESTGRHRLKGIEGDWELFRTVPNPSGGQPAS